MTKLHYAFRVVTVLKGIWNANIRGNSAADHSPLWQELGFGQQDQSSISAIKCKAAH